jgi:hypothetical protein
MAISHCQAPQPNRDCFAALAMTFIFLLAWSQDEARHALTTGGSISSGGYNRIFPPAMPPP